MYMSKNKSEFYNSDYKVARKRTRHLENQIPRKIDNKS